ncbi:Nramp family divalent metal transporter [Auraticoccus monumenti]|uniref:Mn2+ and Fe2+ transporters of the NRAMP family n=1 Tax=Auraticoccus monumenti TaxID=675864 RepID=A0A1G6V842_9ACTN|nr:Nramp family divalent metal transporter [Auraticoccus monumenti]SDD49624.1 Mn2+ and Fe2+ transporters of the NRAMP family [Auraticoccus monumenti]
MSGDTAARPGADVTAPPPRWKVVGPGLMVAATGVGAADMVATLVAGQKFGYALLWVVVLGCLLKIILVEGAGRYSLATRRTIFEGWRSLGRWTTIYFAPYIVIWGFVYGASAMLSSALPLAALFPGVPIQVFAIASGLIGLVLVWFNRYSGFEKITAALVAVMFVTVVGAAVLTTPNLLEVLRGLVPTVPAGSMINILSVAGGVGGTITLAAYGYWLREKGWHTPRFMKVMRLDNAMAYVVTGVFVIAMLIVGAELLYSTEIALQRGDRGLLDLATVLTERYGPVFGKVFLVGFWAASFSSILGVWNGVSLMFADFMGHVRGLEPGHPDTRTGGRWFKVYVLWLTFPPIILVFLGQPVAVILTYGVLGAFFMPFLAVTLIWLLNTDRTPREWRNGVKGNVALGLVGVFFVVLAAIQLRDAIVSTLGG